MYSGVLSELSYLLIENCLYLEIDMSYVALKNVMKFQWNYQIGY